MTRENAAKILREVQDAREMFEKNLSDVWRKHEQCDLFSYFDGASHFGNNEGNVMRIKKQVRDKIKEINNEIQIEINSKKHSVKFAKENIPTKPWHLSLANRKNKQIVSKSPVSIDPSMAKPPLKWKQRAKQDKTIKNVKRSKFPPDSSTAYDDIVLQHIYGRQAHQPHRHTFKNANPLYCSPCRYDEPRTDRSKVPANTHIDANSNTNEARSIESKVRPVDNYCIHLPTNFHNNISPPITHNLQAAIPLVEPSRCLAERVALQTLEDKSFNDELGIRQLSKAGRNVAVINIRADDLNDSSLIKRHVKSRVQNRLKKKMKLRIQSLPNLDIDSITDPSAVSLSSSSQYDENNSHVDDRKLPMESPLTEGEDDENPYSFQDFISVKDVNKANLSKNSDITMSEESFYQPQISLSGYEAPKQQSNDGPAFPPQQYQNRDYNDDIKLSPTLEQHVQDFLEQNLLERLLSRIIIQEKNPPLNEYSDNVSVSSIQLEDEKTSLNWFDHIIGLEGIQLFINAGIPVDKDLISELVRNVIIEILDTLFGNPKPNEIRSEAQVEATENLIFTPIKTPVMSPSTSENNDVKTPDQTVIDSAEQSINDIVSNGTISQLEDEDNNLNHLETVKTPELSISESVREEEFPNCNIKTPDISLIEEKQHSLAEIITPTSPVSVEVAEAALNDFDLTEAVKSSFSAVVNDDEPYNQELLNTPSPVVITSFASVSESPSTPSTTFTASSTTVVGLSTYDGISSGEHLNPDQVISEGSEGELGFPVGIEALKFVEENELTLNVSSVNKIMRSNIRKHLFPSKPQSKSLERCVNSNIDILSEGEFIQTVRQPLKSFGEVSNPSKTVETNVIRNLDEDDTLNEISLSKISNDDNEMTDKIKSLLREENISYPQQLSYKSEGEVKYHYNGGCKGIDILNFNENKSKGLSVLGVKDSDAMFGNDRTVINVKSTYYQDNDSEIHESAKSEGELLSFDSHQEIPKSEGEVVQDEELEMLSEEKDEKEKVVMVLRLPDVEDDQPSTDYDLMSQDDVSDITGLEF